jgi:hypothetical protein
MSTRQSEDGRIRRRIAEIDQHIAVLHKERDELIFAERVLERLKDGGDVSTVTPTTVTPTKVTPVAPSEPDSIEEALSKLESKQFAS